MEPGVSGGPMFSPSYMLVAVQSGEPTNAPTPNNPYPNMGVQLESYEFGCLKAAVGTYG